MPKRTFLGERIHPQMPELAATQTDVYAALNAYLDRALDILGAWGNWLNEHDRMIVSSELTGLQKHLYSAVGLTEDLTELGQARTELLAEARRSGFTCSTLKQLAQSLPQWRTKSELRRKVNNVEMSMTHLRRLNVASWMLVHHCARHANETMLLMTEGSTVQGAYISAPHADTSGGQLLDTQI